MKPFLAIVAVVHGLIHLMGPAKAFGFAELPQLTLPISRPMAVVWLLAAALCLATAMALYAWPHWWWVLGALAVVCSQVVIVTSWADAKYGTIANGILLIGVVIGFLAREPRLATAGAERKVQPSMPSHNAPEQ